MQSTLDTACVVSYNSKDGRRIFGGGQGNSWNTRPKPSLLASFSAAFARVSMCVCTHIYDRVCPCVVLSVLAKEIMGIHMVLCKATGIHMTFAHKIIIKKYGRGLLVTPLVISTLLFVLEPRTEEGRGGGDRKHWGRTNMSCSKRILSFL